MTLNSLRGFFYKLLKFLGDIQALRSPREGAVRRRVTRRVLGKIVGRTLFKRIR
jgi:hypothetical protein